MYFGDRIVQVGNDCVGLQKETLLFNSQPTTPLVLVQKEEEEKNP